MSADANPRQSACECGHPKTEHEDCGDLLVCMHRYEGVVLTVESHPFEGMCSCCHFEEEGS